MAGVPDFGPVQHNVSSNDSAGTTRGIHAEPWDKYVSVDAGRAFGVWVDLRAGDTFGTVVSTEIGPDTAVFVPRGVGNAYQSLVDSTVYAYLVNDHWSPHAHYTAVNLADRSLAIDWPIPLAQAVISDKDRNHPALTAIEPFPDRRPLVLGATGQVGTALRDALPRAECASRNEYDLADERSLLRLAERDWSGSDSVINAAAFTDVDGAETPEGRRRAWLVNATAVGRLARIAADHRLTLVHFSSDYVFDGTVAEHTESEPFSPLGAYGQSKAAGDLAASLAPKHYVLRASWVIGGAADRARNFVTTMATLAERGQSPSVVDDQYGRLTFADEIARAVRHLIDSGAAYGTYHVSGSGPVMSWFEVARAVFEVLGHDPDRVRPIATADYRTSRSTADRPVAERPRHSALALDKIRATGFEPRPAMESLRDYLCR